MTYLIIVLKIIYYITIIKMKKYFSILFSIRNKNDIYDII